MKEYTAKNGSTQFKQSFKVLERSVQDEDSTGFCLACGESQSGVEPDARKYVCESCGAAKVYGAEELVLMGLCY